MAKQVVASEQGSYGDLTWDRTFARLVTLMTFLSRNASRALGVVRCLRISFRTFATGAVYGSVATMAFRYSSTNCILACDRRVTSDNHAVAILRTDDSASPFEFVNKDVARDVKDYCAPGKPTHKCPVTNSTRKAYVFFLNNSTALAVPRGGRDADDNYTYFDYAFAAATRLRSITKLDVVILVTKNVAEHQRIKFTTKGIIVKVIEPMYMRLAKLAKTNRLYHFHTFGKLELFNPAWVGGYDRVVSMDTDTFAIRAPDEMFCMPGRFAATKRPHALTGGFNSGTFLAVPSKKTYDDIMDALISTSFSRMGEQDILNKYFDKSNANCFGVEYNCGGFGPPAIGAGSLKCAVTGPLEDEIFKSRAILHVKLSQRKVYERLPRISKLWRSYLPPL